MRPVLLLLIACAWESQSGAPGPDNGNEPGGAAEVATTVVVNGQAEVLEEDLEQLERPLTSVVSFEIDDGMLMERLTGRLTCKGCSAPFHKTFNPPQEAGVCDDCGADLYTRDDDTEPAVAARLDEYHDKTAPLLGYYETRGLLRSVDAAQPVDGVSGALERALEDR